MGKLKEILAHWDKQESEMKWKLPLDKVTWASSMNSAYEAWKREKMKEN